MTDPGLQRLLDGNLAALEAARWLLEVATVHTGLLQAAGPHLRHAIEHYQAFVAGVGAGRVCYDRRPRNRLLESDPRSAAAAVYRIAATLPALDCPCDHPVRVVFDGPHSDAEIDLASTVGRELQFLLSHCTHHFALLRPMLVAHGIEPPVGFGVSAATLRHAAGQPS